MEEILMPYLIRDLSLTFNQLGKIGPLIDTRSLEAAYEKIALLSICVKIRQLVTQ